MGCDLAQGYYFTPALPPADLADWARAEVSRQADLAA
jgi:EAL domain-containing protein (putative c-di-GMP-specific phosphodiesterase class I)